MNTKGMVLQISDGPSKDRLFDACKYAYGKNVIEINFRFQQNAENPVGVKNIKITTIQHEDGSGYSLNFSGFMDAKLPERECFLPYRFLAYYDARTRKGYIRLIDN